MPKIDGTPIFDFDWKALFGSEAGPAPLEEGHGNVMSFSHLTTPLVQTSCDSKVIRA